MPAEMQLSPRAMSWATDSDIRTSLADKAAEIHEWETVGMTFVKSLATLCIVRGGSLGGDTREVHGGWKYANPFALEMDWREIQVVGNCYIREQKLPRNELLLATMRTSKRR